MNSYSSLTDSELSGLLKIGDRSAFTEIYNRYKAILFSYAYKRILDSEEAKDVIHETFLVIWKKRLELNIPSLPALLFSVLKDKIVDLYRHKKVSDRYIETFADFLETHQTETDYLVRHNDMASLIENEIAALPEKMRHVFELSRKTNLSRKQIAEELNLSEQTVKSHMHHALTILKSRLGSFAFLILFIRP